MDPSGGVKATRLKSFEKKTPENETFLASAARTNETYYSPSFCT